MSAPDLLSDLTDRVRAYERGEPAGVCDPRIVDHVVRLMGSAIASGDTNQIVATAKVVVQAHWYRHQATGHEFELQSALSLASLLTGLDAGAVPPPVAECLNERGRRADEGVRLLGQVVSGSDPNALDRAVALLTAALHATASAELSHAVLSTNLGSALRIRFERHGDGADLERAIELHTAAMNATGTGRPGATVNLAGVMHLRFKLGGDRADLDRCVELLTTAVDLSGSDDAARLGAMTSLGNMLNLRFHHTGRTTDLDRAISLLGDALRQTPHHDHDTRQFHLGGAHLSRFRSLGATADLDKAIPLLAAAADATGPDHPERAFRLRELGDAYQRRFTRRHDPADLERAADCLDAVAQAGTHEYVNLGMVLVELFQQRGDPDHLDRAIEVLTTAGALSDLGNALHMRFRHRHRSADLEGAISRLTEALAATDRGSEQSGYTASNLAVALQTRYHWHADPDDLERVIDLLGTALPLLSPDDPKRVGLLCNLGTALHDRFDLHQRPADLDQAIALLGTAANTAAAIHQDGAAVLGNLGAAMAARFQHHRHRADLGQAVDAHAAAMAATGPHHVDFPIRQQSLAGALYARFQELGDEADLRRAEGLWSQAGRKATTPAGLRVSAGRERAAAIAQTYGPGAAADAYGEVVDLLPLLIQRGSHRSDQYLQLRRYAFGLAGDAAATAVAANRGKDAAETLEQGRGLLWAQLLDTRSDLTRLWRVNPALAARLTALRTELDHPAGGDAAG
ncbi:hypothetical protein GCM10010112_48590 [Actinoplanes lobatus]|uniref:Tetratricopeptide repeat protein n=1 Tax=Actinoplanes lobatus TaxID=113568 RepID=A0A7W7HNZ3_9ACTN|nr:hypothetical protein [Actinoplanes lobatus]MBB4754018.1 hypothetical protein [Actinoplanes lobatus]GGN76464.1 hypothetical protein GCM10010112_48590 [Actinoplanes lobatus]GIE40925.1 hypothetical protein Alo02nite_38230 [Actinoplanes lobatus]